MKMLYSTIKVTVQSVFDNVPQKSSYGSPKMHHHIQTVIEVTAMRVTNTAVREQNLPPHV